MSIRTALIDDHHVVRRGLRSYLESFADITVVGEAASGEEAVNQIEQWLPDVVVMDLLMPGGIDGIETTKRIRTMNQSLPIATAVAVRDGQIIEVGTLETIRPWAGKDARLAFDAISWMASPAAMKEHVKNGIPVAPRFSVSADPEAADVESIDVDLTVVDFAPTLITVER